MVRVQMPYQTQIGASKSIPDAKVGYTCLERGIEMISGGIWKEDSRFEICPSTEGAPCASDDGNPARSKEQSRQCFVK